jgi:hypothetical protein
MPVQTVIAIALNFTGSGTGMYLAAISVNNAAPAHDADIVASKFGRHGDSHS